MKLSELFTKTLREAPADEEAINAKLLIRGGFISKEMAGVYNFLPLGLRVLNKIIDVIKKEMSDLGGQEIFMSCLQRPELWQRYNRWSDESIDIWFKTRLKDGSEKGLAFTHEEPISSMLEQYISSYRDLSKPFSVYQFQTKFRNEIRAQGGLLRTREFIMKDLYSFSKDQSEHQIFYDQVMDAYKKIFDRVGLDMGKKTYITRASGGSFSKFSHEFQTICSAGEDTIYVHPDFDLAVNSEIINEKEAFENLPKSGFKPMKSVEVGNIFTLGIRFSDGYLKYRDENGKENPVFMGSYGIGPGRLMGTAVEIHHDDRGIIWPESIAPYKAHLIVLDGKNKEADKVYSELTEKGIEVLYDDREEKTPGEKFADADLIGCPVRLVISNKTLVQDNVELKYRNKKEFELIKFTEVLDRIK